MKNAKLNSYYLYTFIHSLIQVRWAFFSMSFFYFMGFSIISIMTTILIFWITSLLLLKPVIKIMNRIWEKYVFFLHLIPSVISFFIVINISLDSTYLLYLWMFVHAFTVMFSSIPLTAFLSKLLSKDKMWKEIWYMNNISNVASVIAPIAFWALIDKTWLIIYMWISVCVNFIASFVLWWNWDYKVNLNSSIFHYIKAFPKKLWKWIFISNLPYVLTNDILFIWIISILGNFTVAWFVIWIKTLLEIILTYLIWNYCDKWKVRRIFYLIVIFSSFFWFLVPWVSEPFYASMVQITFWMMNLVLWIPVEYEYHKKAKEDWREIDFSIWKQVMVQSWLVVGTLIIILLTYFLQSLFMTNLLLEVWLNSFVWREWALLFPLWIIMPIWYYIIIWKGKKVV